MKETPCGNDRNKAAGEANAAKATNVRLQKERRDNVSIL
jgi:hypothetical protein